MSIVGTVFAGGRASGLGSSSSPKTWDITQHIPANDRANLIAVQFRVEARGDGSDTDVINYLAMKGGSQPMRNVSIWGIAQSGGDIRRNQGNTNTFYAEVDKALVSNAPTGTNLYIHTQCSGSNDVLHYCYIDGYIVSEGA